MSVNKSYGRVSVICGVLVLSLALLVLAMLSEMPINAAAPQTHIVTIKDFKFVPETLNVNVGDTIVWKNEDIAPHMATSKGKNAFDSGNLDPGASWSYVVKKKGTFSYYCAYHLSMKAKFTVK